MANNTINRKTGPLYSTGELLEILSAASLAASIVLLIKELAKSSSANDPFAREWLTFLLAAVLLFLIAAGFRLWGGAREAEAEKLRLEQEAAAVHEVTAQRLKTLKAVGVEVDILEVLELLLDKQMSAKELTQWLDRKLGPVRAQERLETVLRYTRTSQTRSEPSKTDRQTERDTASAGEKKPAVLEPIDA